MEGDYETWIGLIIVFTLMILFFYLELRCIKLFKIKFKLNKSKLPSKLCPVCDRDLILRNKWDVERYN